MSYGDIGPPSQKSLARRWVADNSDVGGRYVYNPGYSFVADNSDVGGRIVGPSTPPPPPPPVVQPSVPPPPPVVPPDHSASILAGAQGNIAGQESDALRAIQMALGRQGLLGGSFDQDVKGTVAETSAQAAQGAESFAQANAADASASAPIGDLFASILARFQPAPEAIGPPGGPPLAPNQSGRGPV